MKDIYPWKNAKWVNGKKEVTGCWIYNRASDRFTIILDSISRLTGEHPKIVVTGDTPEWGNWKKVNLDE